MEYVYTIGPVGFRVKYLKTDPKYGRVYRTIISDPNNVLTTFDLDVEEEFSPFWWGGDRKSGKGYRQLAAESKRTDREIADHMLNSLLRMIDRKSSTLVEAGIQPAYIAHLRNLLAPYQEYDSAGGRKGTWKTSRLNPTLSGEPTTDEALIRAMGLVREHLATGNKFGAEHDLYRARVLLEVLAENLDNAREWKDSPELQAELRQDEAAYAKYKVNYRVLANEVAKRGWKPQPHADYRGNPKRKVGTDAEADEIEALLRQIGRRSRSGGIPVADFTKRKPTYDEFAESVGHLREQRRIKHAMSNPDTAAELDQIRATAPPALRKAIEGYETFHAWEPKMIGEMNLVMPRMVCVVGEMEQTLYRSDKWENKNSDYFHDHDPGVMIGRTDPSAMQENPDHEMVELPTEIADAGAVYLLGQCLGYSYVQPDGETIEGHVGRPLPELYATPDRKALLIIDPSGKQAQVLAVMWGGHLEVKDVGIVG